MKKRLWGLLAVSLLALGACGTTSTKDATDKKVAPLATTTQLAKSDGKISAAQMKTIVGKEHSYTFEGKDHDINYQWIYQGQQVQNPVKQNLTVTFETTGLEAVKKAAGQASEALGLSIGKMQLAGAPKLVITIPKKWNANKVVLVREVDGKLKKLTGSNVEIKTTANQTTLSFYVLESHVHYYLVGGNQTANETLVAGAEDATATDDPTGESADAADNATTNSDSAATQSSNGENKAAANTTKAGQPGQSGQGAKNSAATKASPSAKTSTNAAAGNDQAAATNGDAKTQTPAEQKSAAAQSENQAAAAKTADQSDQGTTNQTTASKTVTFSISAATILNNWSDLKKEKQPYVPKDGWIVKPTKVAFKEGDSVYDLLVKLTKERGIQMESRWTPMYDAYYVAGINQLYEFDDGNLSGWMYKVNGWFPNYGCSKYKDLHDGDTINWEYTCNLGHDLGASFE